MSVVVNINAAVIELKVITVVLIFGTTAQL